jgi:hypothetical protein
MQAPKQWALEIVEDMRGNPTDENRLQPVTVGPHIVESRQSTLREPLLQEFADANQTLPSNKDDDNDDDNEVACCRCTGFGLQLSPFVLLLIFIYVNLLNYIDRGLVNGVLPTFCVNCPDQNKSIECLAHRSCAWNQSTGIFFGW